MDQNKILDTAKEFTKYLLDSFQLEAEMSLEFAPSDDGSMDKYITLKLKGENLNELVGFHGKNMESIQNILSLMLSKKFEKDLRVLLEVNDYREKREKYLQSIAERAAMDVKSSGQEVELPPMKPYERRAVHMALKQEAGIETESIGEGEERRIVVKLSHNI